MEFKSAQILLESIPEGIFAVDRDFNLLLINPACRSLLNISTSGEVSFFDLVEAFNKYYPIEEVVAQVFSSNRIHRVSEVKVDQKYFKVSAIPVVASPPAAAVFIYDRTEDTNLLQKQEEYMAMVVHDLRSPLTVVKGMAELLVTESENLSDEKQVELLTQIKNSSAEILEIVNSLLDETKSDLQKAEINKSAGDINKVLENEAGNYKGLIEQAGLSLELELDKSVPEVVFDEGKISQVLSNLLSNALKFTKEGNITVRSKAVKDVVKISVEDTGEGISDIQKKTLFKKFSQLENSKHISAHGTGLGLVIAKGIVEAHGGEIWVEDNKPCGAIFVFTLPLQVK